MPVSYEIIDAPHAVVAQYMGQVTVPEVAQMITEYQTDPAFDLARAHIVITKGVDTLEIGFSEMSSVFHIYEAIYKAAGVKMYVAIVPDDDVIFGIARIFQNLTEASDWAKCAICESRDEAETWLQAAMS